MRILPISYNFNRINRTDSMNRVGVNCTVPATLQADTVSFQGVRYGSMPLKALVKYGIYDMYTGLRLLDPKQLDKLMSHNTSNQPLEKLIPILRKQEDTLLPPAREVLRQISKFAAKNPTKNIQDALKSLTKEHEKKLIKLQQPIFEELIQASCDMPKELYKEFMDLMYTTNKRIASDPVIIPFSKKTLMYKLKCAKEDIKRKNKKDEIVAINTLIKLANSFFEETDPALRQITTRKNIRTKKLEYQMRPEILKQNSIRIQNLKEVFQKSVLKNNKDLIQLFDNTSAAIHGFPVITPFKNKEFEYDLKRITKHLKNRELASKMIHIAHKLPVSAENESAFIVKYANELPSKIVFSLLKDGVCSVDHLKAKKKGGQNGLANFGLCSTYINYKKTNINFDDWCRMHPEVYKNCQKYIDRMIELYNDGIFAKEGLKREYITDFAETVKELSPKEKPLILNLEKLKD